LVYVAGREHVTHVWVGGRCLIQNKVLLHNDNKELLRISRLWQNSLQNERPSGYSGFMESQ